MYINDVRTAVLPPSGIITVSDLAEFSSATPKMMQQALTDNGIPILMLAGHPDMMLVRLEDLRKRAE